MVSYPPRYCINCGAANQQQAAFCFACGQSLQSQVDTTPISSATVGSLAPNHLLKDRYRIVAEIGKGGMGTVYKAGDTLFGNHFVAIKELSQSSLNAQEMIEATTAFKREAHLLVGLDHPNLPKIIDYFADGGRWYLVMNFIEGETLETYLTHKTGGYLPVNEALDMGMQLCSVLDYLHTRQPPIIFRDLKPSNVMRTANGHLYLIDFGIARHFHPGKAKDTTALGSVGYAAPEQYGKAQTTPLSDIYSLGAVLYELLTGTDPSQSYFQFAPLHLHELPFPEGLEALVAQMLEKDASKRPASMAVIKQELQRISARVPAIPGRSQPGPLLQQSSMQRLTRSSKVKIIALVGLTLLAVSGIGLFSLVQVNQVASKQTRITPTANVNATATTAAFQATETVMTGSLTPANATATATVIQNMYDSATRGIPVVDDPLRNNNKDYGWFEGSNGEGGTCAFKDGAYHVSQANTDYFEYCPAIPTFSNFVFEVQMKIIKGDSGGIMFRANTSENFFYVFLVGSNGSYQLFLCTGGAQCNEILINSFSSAINQGLNQTNLITVIAQNSTIGLYVNHQFIGSVVNNTYGSGQIGVLALPLLHPTEVVYSNAKVWTL